MERKVNTKFFSFSQNNSGGSFDKDEASGIGEYVIIEAIDADHANGRAIDIGLYFDGCVIGNDCPCCGDRWSRALDDDGEDVPSIYSTPIEEAEKSTYRDAVFVHYLDGTFKKFELKERAKS